jgi:predicted Zn-ribbon and HTH transcriptional regulator
MAVVKLEYTRNKQEIKANLRYFTHRKGRENAKITRDIFTNVGQTGKQEFYRQVSNAGRGTVFFKFMTSPDPKREDSLKDLDLRHITRRTIRKMEKAIGRRLLFVAAVHNADHTPLRHVHGIFLVKGRLSKEHFRALSEVARAEPTREARLWRHVRDLTRLSPRYQTLSRNRREAIHGRGGGRVPKVQPGCSRCGFGEIGGIPAYKTHCPICRSKLREERQVRFHLNRQEGRLL